MIARAPARSAPPSPFERDAAQRRGAHEQGLLQDQHEGGGNDIARVAAGGVEERLRHQLDRRTPDQAAWARLPSIARPRGDPPTAPPPRDSLPYAAVEQKIGRIDIGGEPCLLPFSTSRSVPRGIPKIANTCRRASAACASASVAARPRPQWPRRRSEPSQIAAELRAVLIDDRDRMPRSTCPR